MPPEIDHAEKWAELPGVSDDLRARLESVAEGLIATRKQTKPPANYPSKKDLANFAETFTIETDATDLQMSHDSHLMLCGAAATTKILNAANLTTTESKYKGYAIFAPN